MTDVRAFWITAPGRGEIRDEPALAVRAGEVVIRASYSAISRGTEALVFNGQIPASEHERMRAPFQSGDFSFPIKYGYSSVGVVESGPDGLAGRRAFVLFPHQTKYVVTTDAVHLIPDDVPSSRAVLAANLETAINGVWDGTPRIGDRVAVVGAGMVGCLVAWLAARIAGCEVELADINPRREAIAQQLGARFRDPRRLSGDADVVFHTSGSPAGLSAALAAAGMESTVVDLSWYGDRSVPLQLGERFHSGRLTLKSSQVGRIPPAQGPRWNTRRRMALALSMLSDPVLDVLITGESAFDELPQTLERLAAAPGDALCHRIRYE